MIAHQKICASEGTGCIFNSKLLQYFIQKEFVEKSQKTQEIAASPVPVATLEPVLHESKDDLDKKIPIGGNFCHQVSASTLTESTSPKKVLFMLSQIL